MGHPDALLECVNLLADPDVAARTGAIRAIADAGRPDGVLLLRLKALLGDKEIEVTGECFGRCSVWIRRGRSISSRNSWIPGSRESASRLRWHWENRDRRRLSKYCARLGSAAGLPSSGGPYWWQSQC